MNNYRNYDRNVTIETVYRFLSEEFDNYQDAVDAIHMYRTLIDVYNWMPFPIPKTKRQDQEWEKFIDGNRYFQRTPRELIVYKNYLLSFIEVYRDPRSEIDNGKEIIDHIKNRDYEAAHLALWNGKFLINYREVRRLLSHIIVRFMCIDSKFREFSYPATKNAAEFGKKVIRKYKK